MTNYRERAYSRYSVETTIDYSRLAKSYDRRLTRSVHPRIDWTCLDLACGYGNFLAYLRAVGITKFIGIDTSEATIAVARKEFGDERVLQIDAFKFLTSSQESFDLISAIDFIEHVSKDELYRLMDAILESLHPEGLLLCRIPNGNGLFGMASRYNDITHETCFTPVSITDVMERSGFDVLRIWEDQGSPTSLAQLFHWGAWQAVRFFIRCIDAIETGDWGDGVLTRNMWVLAWKSRNGKA